jgi:2'-5' RNA ligase
MSSTSAGTTERPISSVAGPGASPGPATETALVIPIPEAEGLVGELRAEFDHAAALGVPAHVTVISPFVPPDLVTADVLADVAQVIGTVQAFEVTFGGTSWFHREVLWLAPRPDTGFRQLISAVWERFPDYPPYQGAHAEVIPHLTVGHSQPAGTLEAVAQRLDPRLPITARARVAWLMEGTQAAGSWRLVAEFPLGAERQRK